MKQIIPILALVMLICMPVFAAPTTNPVTDVNCRTATFNAAGGTGTGWFEWGGISGTYIWTTPNQSVSGVFSDTQNGAPMLSGKTFYVRACDSTGCGGEVSFTTQAAEMIGQTRYGIDVIDIQRSGFNITKTIPYMLKPYTFTFSPWGIDAMYAGMAMWGVFFLFVFAGYWLRQKDMVIPTILALATASGMITSGLMGISGAPPEFVSIGVGLLIAGIAGIFMSLVSK